MNLLVVHPAVESPDIHVPAPRSLLWNDHWSFAPADRTPMNHGHRSRMDGKDPFPLDHDFSSEPALRHVCLPRSEVAKMNPPPIENENAAESARMSFRFSKRV